MKIKYAFLSSVLVAAATAAPLTQPAAVHTRPSPSAPVVQTLAAGTEPVAVTTGYGVLPTGWIAVALKGPHEVYVQQKDLTKSLDVKPGAPLHLEPKPEGAVVATAAEGDETEIIGLHGRWTQLLLKKDLVGYVQVSSSPPATPAKAPVATPAPAPSATPAPSDATPPAPPVAGRAVPPGVQGAGEQALPRLFQGRLTSTRNPFRPRRPYDYQLTGEGGQRYAYADLSKLLLTEQLDKYVDRTVVVYGAAHQVPGTDDIVILVESLQLR